MNLTRSDILAAAIPPVAGFSLADVNHLASLASLLLGASYLVWKWYREANTPPASK